MPRGPHLPLTGRPRDLENGIKPGKAGSNGQGHVRGPHPRQGWLRVCPWVQRVSLGRGPLKDPLSARRNPVPAPHAPPDGPEGTVLKAPRAQDGEAGRRLTPGGGALRPSGPSARRARGTRGVAEARDAEGRRSLAPPPDLRARTAAFRDPGVGPPAGAPVPEASGQGCVRGGAPRRGARAPSVGVAGPSGRGSGPFTAGDEPRLSDGRAGARDGPDRPLSR